MSDKQPQPFDYDPNADVDMTLANRKFELTIIKLLQSKYFYGPLSCEVSKLPSKQIPTMGVAIKDGQFQMLWNPSFLMALAETEAIAILEHEFLHLLLDHPGRGDKYRGLPHKILNIAADASINQYIENIPAWAVQPATIGAEKGMSFEGYVEHLMDKAEKNGDGGEGDEDGEGEEGEGEGKGKSGSGNGSGGTGDGLVDDHSGWDKLSPEERKVASEKMKSIGRRVQTQMAGKGHGGLYAELTKMLEEQIDWRAHLRRFTQHTISSAREFTRTRPNRRDWDMPGAQRTETCTLLFAIDTSGSMSDEDLCKVYGDIWSLSHKHHIDVDVMMWDDGILSIETGTAYIKAARICGRGGTDCSEVFRFIDDPNFRKQKCTEMKFKARKKYDGVILYSDFFLSAPPKPRNTKNVLLMIVENGGEPPMDWGRRCRVNLSTEKKAR